MMKNMKRMISLILAFAMVFGMVTLPSQANAKGDDAFVEAKYKVENVDGKSYKAYKFTDLVGKSKTNKKFKINGLEVSEPRIMKPTRGSNPALGEEIPDAEDYQVDVQWTTYDLAPGDLGTPVFFQIRDTKTNKLIAQTENATLKAASKKYKFYKLPAWNDAGVSHDPADWEMRVPVEYKFDVRLDTGASGQFEYGNIKAKVVQRSNPIYRAEYFTNKKNPGITVQRTNKNNRTNEVAINNENLAENEYYSWAEPISGYVTQYYEGKELEIKKNHYGNDALASLEISDDITAGRCRMKMKAPGKTDFDRGPGEFKDNGTPYHYEVTGDHIKAHIFTIRQDLKVKFDPNKGTWKGTAPADQTIGHSMKLGDSWAGLGPITVPGENDLTPPEVAAGKPGKKFIGWNTDANATTALFTDNTYAQPITDNATFYAIYAEKAQGKIKVEYKDSKTNAAIDSKYQLKGQEYPAEKPGDLDEAIKDEVFDTNKAPKFLGYKIKSITTDPVPNPPTTANYTKNGDYTVIYTYDKLDSVIPEKEGDKTNTKPDGYVTVTFKAGDNGKINGDTADVKFFVNPKDDIKFGNDKIVEPTVVANDTYDVKDTKWNPDFNAKKTETITADATFTAQYEKQKGTVSYVYEYKNETSITDPSKTDIPTLPTDSKEYEVGNEVTAETTVTKGKTIPVKDNKGTVIGNWTFSGWDPAKLTINKNSQTVKNEFKGTWTFSEAGKHNVTYEFQSGTNGVELPGEVKNLLTLEPKADQYEGTTVTAPTETYAPVEIKTGDNPGTWTFNGWNPKKLTVGPKNEENKFIGVWTFEKAKSTVSYKFEYEPAGTTADKTGIPAVPTDATKYEVGEKVTPNEVTPTNVEVKDAQNNVIGIWSFQGWEPKELTVKLEADKNVFTGKWLFAEKLVMSHKYVVEGTTTLPAELEAPKDVYIAKGTDYKPEGPKTKFYEAIEDTTDHKFYDYTFKSWDPAELKEAQEDKEFIGTWTRVQSKSAKPQIKTPTEGDKVIEGKGKPGSDIEVTIPGVNDPIHTTVNNGGKWKVDVPEDKNLKSGEKIVVKQTEKGKTPSESTAIVKSDKPSCMTPAPEINPVYDSDEYITGHGIAGAVIEVRYRDYPILRTKVDTFGEWEVYTPYPLEDEQFVYARQIKEPCDPSVWVSEEIRYDDEYWRKDDKKEEPKKPVEIKKVWTPAELNARDHFSYIKGYGDNTFGPNRTITRAEVAMIFARLSINQSVSGAPQFTDVKPGDWYRRAVDIVARQGVVKGYEDGTFRPNQPITRREFAAIAARYAGNIDAWRTFRDVPSTDWAYTLINRVGGAGWITGYEDNTFRPNNLITRAEVVAIVNRMLNRKADKAYVDNNLMKSKHSFIDNLRSAWYFYDVHEAAVGHAFERQPNGVDEKWNRVTGQAFEIGKDVMYR